jgi:hypothetical protein
MTARLTTPGVALSADGVVELDAARCRTVEAAEARSSGGSVLGLFSFGDSPIERPGVDGRWVAAAVKALAGVPDAGALLDVTIEESSFQGLVWSTWRVTVRGRAVTIPER